MNRYKRKQESTVLLPFLGWYCSMKRNDNYCRHNSPFLSGKECYAWLNLQGASEEEKREEAREQ